MDKSDSDQDRTRGEPRRRGGYEWLRPQCQFSDRSSASFCPIHCQFRDPSQHARTGLARLRRDRTRALGLPDVEKGPQEAVSDATSANPSYDPVPRRSGKAG